VGGFHFTERVSVRFHLRAAPEDFTFCRQAKDFTFFDVWHTNVLLAEVCDKKPAKIRILLLSSAGFYLLSLRTLGVCGAFFSRGIR